ncbi:MAG TPA: SpoIID/LytB domain-containing protein [Polyangia bacterium]|nr:SpoIID/LytB domain-containing protein [Polyangia bacterium]
MKRIALAALLVAASGVSADELSGADKLRVVYSNQFSWTRDGLPIVTVRVMEHRPSVTLSAEGMRVVPDGEGGPEVKGGATWTVRIVDGKPGRVVTHNVVASFAPSDTEALQAELAKWRAKKIATHTFETGALFAVKGQVLDSRKILVAAAGTTGGTPFPELVDRPRGTVEAVDERGVVVRNDSILWFEPGPAGTIALADVDNERGGKETRRYFGKIYVTVDNAGQLAVVNAVPEDKLLAGLVPAEMSASSPPEALKAQAVAARNELLAKIGTRHLTDPYRLCSTVHCQVYAGAGREDARATAAVQATRGELLVRDHDGGLVDAVYSASCGGHGENNENVWGGTPDLSLRGRLDADPLLAARLPKFATIGDAELRAWLAIGPSADGPWCARPKEAQINFRWQKPIDLAALESRVAVGRLRELTVLERGVSGRATRLRLVGDRGEKELHGELEIRRALGNLKSAMFVLDATRDASGHLASLTAIGGGHGHGVGMCQVGAVGMASSGKSYTDILRQYYPASHVRKLY